MAPRTVQLLALLLPLTAMSASNDAAPVVEDAPASAEERAAFNETVDRYTDRLRDFNTEARYIADSWEAQERSRLADSYAGTLSELEARKLELRDGSMKRFEDFLAKYPGSEYTPHVMFRLGEIYFEVAEEAYLEQRKTYDQKLAEIGALPPEQAATAVVPDEPLKDYERSVALYQRIVRDYPSYQYADGAYYMLGYCMARDIAKQYDALTSRDMYASLVEKFPESQFAPSANMQLGEYYFNENQMDQAIVYYQKVVDEGKDAKLYDRGLYKLAWSYYKKAKTEDEYSQALGLFANLLDWSEQNLKDTGRESPVAPEAIQYMAISFSDMADRRAAGWVEGLGPRPSPVTEATSFFSKLGEREYEIKIYKRLADVLTQQSRFDEAIATLKLVQDRWPEDEDNPSFQRQIAQLNMNLTPPNPDGARQALLELSERYNDTSTWAAANRNNPEALDSARDYIEESLAIVATNYHQTADAAAAAKDSKEAAAILKLAANDPASVKTAITSTYRKAGELYQEYLNKFPFADDYYEIQSYLATVLVNTDQLPQAEKVFEQLLKAGDVAYRDASLWQLMQVRRQLLIAKYGAAETRPEAAVEEKRVTLPSGKERVIYQLDEDHKKFIEVCDALVAAEFTDKDYKQALDEFRPALAYLPAQILYNYGHYDEARPRFEKVIATWQERDEAAFSARLMVDSYADEEDLVRVRLYAGKYAAMALGPQKPGGPENGVFKSQQEGAAFKLAEGLIATDRKAAAEAFVAFMAEFPRSQYIKDAHYNAANSYDIIGRVDEANRLFEEYVNKYPKDERSAQLFYRIAFNYSSVLELDKAIRYYETLVTNFPDFPDASGALYNAGFLRIGQGDHEGAAKNFERYATRFSTQKDAETTMFLAGDQWEKVGDAQAASFYQRYVKAYPSENPDHVMEAYNRLAKLAEKSGNAKAIDKAYSDLASAYARLAPTGKIGSAGRHYAAAAEYRKIEAELAAFKVYKFSNNEEKNTKLVLEEKKAALEAFINHCLSLISTYQDFDYSSAALLAQGEAYYAYADMIYKFPCPAQFNEEQCGFFAEQLDTVRLPVEEKGHNRLVATLELSQQEKRWSEYQVGALEMLNERDPQTYAKDKAEIRGVGDSNLVPTAGPLALPKPEQPAPPPADGTVPPATPPGGQP